MQFGVLGPLRVTDGSGEPVAVSAPRLRVLLAVLLWRANHPVAVDELAEMVWDGTPPAGAAEATRALVMRLRRVLGQPVGARLVTRAPGYVIELVDDELDASRFETLSSGAGAAIRAERWAEAAPTAAAALGLWRGTALVDVSSRLLRDAWAPHLEQARVQALEWRFEAELHKGGHEELIPELRQVTGHHPLRERFHAQLMLALARAGRQSEALAVYREARLVLVGELGIEPGQELRALHERILAGDTALAAPPRALGEIRPLIPRQLPAGVRSFTGRQTELLGLMEQAEQSAEAGRTVVIAAIDGMAGVGKTALAVHVAYRLASRFPDGQLFIDLHGYTEGYEPRTPADALDWLLRALGTPAHQIPQDVEERAALYRQRLADTRTLVVLDNAASEAQVRPLLPGGTGCLVLVTSRRHLKGLDDAHVLSLDVLPPGDAITLLRKVAGPGGAADEDPMLAEIAGLCGHLPLALRIAAALLRHRPTWTPGRLARLLGEQRQRISALSDGERDLGTVFDMSYQGLAGPLRYLFRSLGLVPGPDVDACAAAALVDTDPASATRLLEELTDHNLLIQQVPGRYRLHDLIRLHARALADGDPLSERDRALDRLQDYYQGTASRADALIARRSRPVLDAPVPADAPALPDPAAAWAWLRTERPNLIAVLHHAAGHGHQQRFVALAAGLDTMLSADGPWTQAIALHTAAATAARLLGDHSSQADALVRLGNVRGFTGDFPGAIRALAHALRLYRDLGSRLGQTDALTRLGDVRILTGAFPNATRDLREALRLAHDLGEQSAQAHALIRLGKVQRMTGDLPGAVRDLEQALDLYRALGYRLGQATALSRLGDVRILTGDFAGAARDQEQALELYRDLGNQLGEGSALALLGQVRLSLGDHRGAARHLEAAVDLFRRIGARGNEAWALNHYAAVVTAAGDRARAHAIYLDALHLARETRQPDDEALALAGIGECHLHVGDTGAGVAHLNQALKIFQRLTMKPEADRVQARLTMWAGVITRLSRSCHASVGASACG
jgi:DNA-binding SARP family transcriptional activator/tetratricopeptide (TPR) repeat protein